MIVNETTLTTQQVAARFSELAQAEKWFEIQDELFDDNVRSVEPANSPYLGYAEGKTGVRKKAEDWVKRITAVHKFDHQTNCLCQSFCCWPRNGHHCRGFRASQDR
jgi:hypothetical protein